MKIEKKRLWRFASEFSMGIVCIFIWFVVTIVGASASTTVTEVMLSIIGGGIFLIFFALFEISLEISWFRKDLIEFIEEENKK